MWRVCSSFIPGRNSFPDAGARFWKSFYGTNKTPRTSLESRGVFENSGHFAGWALRASCHSKVIFRSSPTLIVGMPSNVMTGGFIL